MSEIIPFDKKARKRYLKKKKKAQEEIDWFLGCVRDTVGYVAQHGNEISEKLHNIIEEAEKESED